MRVRGTILALALAGGLLAAGPAHAAGKHTKPQAKPTATKVPKPYTVRVCTTKPNTKLKLCLAAAEPQTGRKGHRKLVLEMAVSVRHASKKDRIALYGDKSGTSGSVEIGAGRTGIADVGTVVTKFHAYVAVHAALLNKSGHTIVRTQRIDLPIKRR